MRRWLSYTALAGIAGFLWSSAAALAADEPKSEGHPHKWVVVEKSMYDLVSDGFDLITVAYDTSSVGPKMEPPDVHYFLQKEHEIARCDFRKREETSYYWCYMLSKPGAP
jgi:hypothetical protein